MVVGAVSAVTRARRQRREAARQKHKEQRDQLLKATENFALQHLLKNVAEPPGPRKRRVKRQNMLRSNEELVLPDGFKLKQFLERLDEVFTTHKISRSEVDPPELDNKTPDDMDADEMFYTDPAYTDFDLDQLRYIATILKETPEDMIGGNKRDHIKILMMDRMLRVVPYFAAMPRSLRKQLWHQVYSVDCKRGDVIYQRGDVADHVFVILSGTVVVSSLVRRRVEKIYRSAQQQQQIEPADDDDNDRFSDRAMAAVVEEDEEEEQEQEPKEASKDKTRTKSKEDHQEEEQQQQQDANLDDGDQDSTIAMHGDASDVAREDVLTSFTASTSNSNKKKGSGKNKRKKKKNAHSISSNGLASLKLSRNASREPSIASQRSGSPGKGKRKKRPGSLKRSPTNKRGKKKKNGSLNKRTKSKVQAALVNAAVYESSPPNSPSPSVGDGEVVVPPLYAGLDDDDGAKRKEQEEEEEKKHKKKRSWGLGSRKKKNNKKQGDEDGREDMHDDDDDVEAPPTPPIDARPRTLTDHQENADNDPNQIKIELTEVKRNDSVKSKKNKKSKKDKSRKKEPIDEDAADEIAPKVRGTREFGETHEHVWVIDHVCTLSTGDVFGERCVFELYPRHSTVVAIESTKLLVIHKYDYHRLLSQNVTQRSLIRMSKALNRAGCMWVKERPKIIPAAEVDKMKPKDLDPEANQENDDNNKTDKAKGAGADGDRSVGEAKMQHDGSAAGGETVPNSTSTTAFITGNGTSSVKGKLRGRKQPKLATSSSTTTLTANQGDLLRSPGNESTDSPGGGGFKRKNSMVSTTSSSWSMKFGGIAVPEQQAQWLKRQNLKRRLTISKLRDPRDHQRRVQIEGKYLRPFYMPKDNRSLTVKDRVHKAGMFVRDGMRGRRVRAHRTTPCQMSIDRVLNSRGYEFTMFVLVLLHMGLAFFEPPSRQDQSAERFSGRMKVLLGAEAICALAYLTEMLFHIADLGLFVFLRHRKRWAQFIVTGIVCADVAISCFQVFYVGEDVTHFRFSRIIRPLLLLFRSRYLRQLFYLAAKILPRLVELFILLAGLIVFFTVCGLFLFQQQSDVYDLQKYQQAQPPYHSCEGETECPPLPDSVFEAFEHSWAHASLGLFVLLTTSNYPEISVPPYMVSHQYQLFFIAFLIIGTFFLMNLIVAVIYDAYRDQQAKMFEDHAKKEDEALHAAFRMLDVYDAGVLTWTMFRLVIKNLRPKHEEYQIRTLFALMDLDGDGVIDEGEFKEIVDGLFVRIQRKKNAHFLDHLSSTNLLDDDVLEKRRRHMERMRGYRGNFAEKLVDSRAWDVIFSTVVCVDVVALMMMSHDINSSFARMLDLVCAAFFASELVLQVYARGGQKFWTNSWNVFDVGIAASTWVGLVKLHTSWVDGQSGLDWIGVCVFFGLIRFLRVVSLVAASRTRISSHAASLMSLTATLVRMVPVFLVMTFALVAIVFYPFGIVGMEIFNGGAARAGQNRCDDVQTQLNIPTARFCDMGASQLMLFQVLTNANWHLVVYEAIRLDGFWTSVYFVLFYFVAVMLLVNLIVALFLDLFMGERDVRVGGQELANVLNNNQSFHKKRRASGHELMGSIGSDDEDNNRVAGAGGGRGSGGAGALSRGGLRATFGDDMRSSSGGAPSVRSGGSSSTGKRRQRGEGGAYFEEINEGAQHIIVSESSSIQRMHRRLRKQYDSGDQLNLIDRQRVVKVSALHPSASQDAMNYQLE